jgi:hypothetical protein
VASVRRIRISSNVKVLSFAAVGSHGREWWTRFASSALALAMLPAPAFAQSSRAFLDLAPDLASKIAAALAPAAAIRLSFPADDERVQAEVARLLGARGFRVVEDSDAAIVSGSCLANLRERVCVAAIGRGDARRVVMTTRLRAGDAAVDRDPVVALELRPLYTQRGPMLDVAEAGGKLLVLTPDAVALIADADTGALAGRAVASQPIRTSRVWPRDLRGMLRVTVSGFEAFLPGVICRGTASPFTLACADENEPWPIGLDNGGLAPSRNTFSTPEGLTFYEGASLGGGRWLLVGEQGVLTFLDAGRRVTARGDVADHAIGFPESCAADGSYVVTAARSPETSHDTLRLSRLVNGQLVRLPSTIALAGVLTSLWAAPGARAATAIVHDFNAGRYEAFHITLSCAR